VGKEPETSDHAYGVVPPVAANVWAYAVPTVPEGSGDVVVMTSGLTAGSILRLNVVCVVCAVALLSVTRIVKPNEPAAVGVPVSEPPAERLSPVGKEPETSDHAYGVVPPVAANVWAYAVPTVPAGSGEPVEMETGVRGLMTKLKTFCAVRGGVVSLTRIVKLKVPEFVGVPLSMPPDDRLSPGGREPPTADHVYDADKPPALWNVWEYGIPTVPAGSESVCTRNSPPPCANTIPFSWINTRRFKRSPIF
jgi:hypothetical protein